MWLLIGINLIWLLPYLYNNRVAFAMRFLHGIGKAGDYQREWRWLKRIEFAIPKVLATHRRGLILTFLGREAEAEVLYRDALQMVKDGAPYAIERLYCSLAHALTDLGRFDEAEACYRQAINAGDVTGNSQSGLAELRLRRGDSFDEALAFADQAIELASRRSVTHSVNQVPAIYYADRAWVRAKLGHAEAARQALIAAKPRPSDTAAGLADVEWTAGLALLTLGATAEAIERFQAGGSVDPQSKYGRRCRAELAKLGVEFRPVHVPIRGWLIEWSPAKKGWTAFAALGVISLFACELVGRVKPGAPPNFQESGRAYRFSAGKWTEAPVVKGGVDQVAVSPGGVVWTTTPRRDAMLRWDGAQWVRYDQPDLVYGFALRGEELWVTTGSDVVSFDGREWRHHPEVTAKASIAAGPAGVWISDFDGTLSHFDGKAWTTEKLQDLPGVGDWKQLLEDGSPEMRVTSDGALWLLLGRLWRRDAAGWQEVDIPNLESSGATLAAQDSGNIWLHTMHSLIEVRADRREGRTFRVKDLPIGKGWGIFAVAAAEGKVWLATSKDLLMFDGKRWQRYGVPPGSTVVKDVALAPDGSVWVLGENRPIWRIGWWLAAPLGACALVLFAIGGLLVMWAKGLAKSRFKKEVVLARAAGESAGEIAAREAQMKKQTRALWWKVPGFLIGFPYLIFGVRLAKDNLHRIWPGASGQMLSALAWSPVVLICAFLLVRWLRRRAKSAPLSDEIWIVIGLAVYFYFYNKLPVPDFPGGSVVMLLGFILILPAVLLSRTWLVRYLTTGLAEAGEYQRALQRLRWLRFGWPNAEILLREGCTYASMGRGADAEKALREALRRARSSDVRNRNHILCMLGYTLSDLGRFDEAQRCLENVIDLGDYAGNARFGIADLLLQQAKEPEKALALIDEAMRIHPTQPPLPERMGNKAWALALLGRQQEMNDSITAAVSAVDPAKKVVAASVHWRVGKALAAVKQVGQAVEHFRKAWQTDPDGHHGKIARLELQQFGSMGD